MKNCRLKCQQWAPLKVGTLKADKQPQDELLRYLSSRAQISHLVTAQDDLRRSIRQLVKRSWTKTLTPLGHQGKWGVAECHIYLTRCEPNYDFKHMHEGATMYVRNTKGTSRSANPSNYIRMTFSTTKAVVGESIGNLSPTWLYQLTVGWHVFHVFRSPYH